ncbi:MAG: indolepyruvate oxidoreductase subunit beta [Deltaproteobacteria bacterium]|nr:MAG: indolepyruvate oxidoreductase subunit beta [Deltaproteobacteria bacterium]
MTDAVTNIYMVGVGGQGTLLASEILSEVLMLQGYDVKKAEVHGMAQRGGSVVSHVRFGKKVYSPIIPEGEGDILFAFELLEAYRCLPLLKPSAKIVVNNLKIMPPGVNLGQETYPEDVPDKIRRTFPDTLVVEGIPKALEAGSDRAVNTVMLGALSRQMNIPVAIWEQAIRHMVPERYVDLNLRAFALGRAD